MRAFGLRLLLVALLLGASGLAHAAPQHAVGCPAGAQVLRNPGPVATFDISWTFQGIPSEIGFGPTEVRYGPAPALTSAEVEAYAPMLDNLRTAVQTQRRVVVYWNDTTNVVSRLIFLWDQPC